MDTFIQNNYKQYEINDITVDRMYNIVIHNSMDTDGGKDRKGKELSKSSIFGIKSFINHNKKINVTNDTTSDLISFVRATRDIEEGEQIFTDYI